MIENLLELLYTGNYSCVIMNGTEIRTYTRRGVADLYELHLHPISFTNGAIIADKVIGIAAAALIIVSGIKKVLAEVISQPAINLLCDAGIEVDYRQMVAVIANRTKTGWCPLEERCRTATGVKEIIHSIEKFMLEQEIENRLK